MALSILFLVLIALVETSRASSHYLWALNITDDTRQRIWYGDGKAYIGPVPPEVNTALNITVSDERADLLYVAADTTGPNPGSVQLPDPTFLVASMRKNATASIFFAHSAVNLVELDNYLWLIYAGYLLPQPQTNMLGGGFYLMPASANGTWNVRFFTSYETAKQLGALRTDLYINRID